MKITIEGRPISKKRNYRRAANGRMFLSGTYKKFEGQTLRQIGDIKEMITGPMKANYIFYIKGKMRIDLDNAIASVNDILQTAGAIDNDNNILMITAEKRLGNEDWLSEIEIERIAR